MFVQAREGAPLVAEWALAQEPSKVITIETPEPLAPARSAALSEESIREQFESDMAIEVEVVYP